MRDRINVNEGLWEFCKYQNELLKTYKEFIEKTLLVKILESSKPADEYRTFNLSNPYAEVRTLDITIPETRFRILQTPNIQKHLQMLNYETPVIQPEIYCNVLYKAMEEQLNADSN